MVKKIVRGLAIVAFAASSSAALASASNMAAARANLDGTAFYDDHYGSFYDGYWTAAGEYFFSTGPNRPYVRDDGHHFSRVMAPGFRPVESLAVGRAGEFSASR